MIVPSMNSEELLIEIYKDLEGVNRKAISLTQGLRRQAIKSKGKYVQVMYDYKSLRHNHWFIIVDHYVKDPYYNAVLHYTNHAGLNGVLVGKDNKTLIHYTPHFLDRYNERFLKRQGASRLSLLKRFIPANSVQTIKSIRKFDGNKKQTFGRFNEGIGLGYKEVFTERGKAIHHFKTFISTEMVLEYQIEDFNTLGKLYERYLEEMYVRRKKRA